MVFHLQYLDLFMFEQSFSGSLYRSIKHVPCATRMLFLRDALRFLIEDCIPFEQLLASPYEHLVFVRLTLASLLRQ